MFPWCLIIACSIFYFRYLSSQVHLELAYLYLYYYEFKRARVIAKLLLLILADYLRELILTELLLFLIKGLSSGICI